MSSVQSGAAQRLCMVLVCALALAACAPFRREATAAPEPGHPAYDGVVSVDPAARHVRAAWTLRLASDPSGADSVVFRLNGGLALVQVSGPAVRGYRDSLQEGYRRVSVFLAPGTRERTITFAYEGKPLFSGDSINGISDAWVELALDSHWLPVVSDYAQALTGTLRVTLPAGWQVTTSGTVRRDGDDHVIRQTVPLIDLPFSAAPRFRMVTGERSQIFHVNATDSAAATVSRTADGCAGYLDREYGVPTPLPPLRIVLAPRRGPGYARKNYIVITSLENMTPRALTRFVCHEVAHFWATGAVSSGPDNWLNEGFAEFVSNRAVRELVGQTAYDTTLADWKRNAEGQPPIWTGPGGRRPGPRVSYSKAPYLLHRLEERIGAATMSEFLRRFMTSAVRTTPAVIELLRTTAGDDTANWFAAELRSG